MSYQTVRGKARMRNVKFWYFYGCKVIGNKFTWAGELVGQFLRNKILITDPCSIANMCTQYFSQVDAIWEFTRSSCE